MDRENDYFEFSYIKKLRSFWTTGKIYHGIFIYVPSTKSKVLNFLLLFVPTILFAIIRIPLLPKSAYWVNWGLLILIWFVIISLISPFYTQYKLLKNEKPVFIKILLRKINWGVIVGYSTGISLRYYDNLYYHNEYSLIKYILIYVLPVAGIMLLISVILAVISYKNEKRKSKDQT